MQQQQLQAKEHQLEQLLQSHEQLVAKQKQLLILETQDAGDFLPALSAKSKMSNWTNENTHFLTLKPFFPWNEGFPIYSILYGSGSQPGCRKIVPRVRHLSILLRFRPVLASRGSAN